VGRQSSCLGLTTMQGACDVNIIASTTVDIWVPTGKLPPSPGGPEFSTSNLATLDKQPNVRMGGIGGNAAAVLGGLGGEVALFTNLAADFWGNWARSQLEARGVKIIAPAGLESTSVHIAVTGPQGQRLSFFYPGEVTFAEPSQEFRAKWILFGGCPHPALPDIARMLRQSGGAVTFLDIGPNLGQEFNIEAFAPLFSTIDWLIGNESELAGFTGSDPESGARRVAGMAKQGVILKRGDKGAAVFFRQRRSPLWARPFHILPQNTIGAGDAFNGGLLYGMSRGWEWEDMLRFANAVAAYTVQAPQGTLDIPKTEVIFAFIQSRPAEGVVMS